jgi:hypothetical protein
LDNIENDVKEICLRGWRKLARDREAAGCQGSAWTTEPVEKKNCHPQTLLTHR